MPSTEQITVVVGVSRSSCIQSTIANFERQSYPSKILLLALNGEARDATVPTPHRSIRTETGTPAKPRNAGLVWAKAQSIPLVCFWDDDDYYGPGYLDEAASALRAGERVVVGNLARYIRFDNELCYFHGKQDWFLGGTIAGWTQELLPIPDLPRDEDRRWCLQLRAAGFELRTLSGLHYVYNRKSGWHAWQASKLQMLWAFGPALSLGPLSDETSWHPPVGGRVLAKPTDEEILRDIVAQQSARLGLPNPYEQEETHPCTTSTPPSPSKPPTAHTDSPRGSSSSTS